MINCRTWNQCGHCGEGVLWHLPYSSEEYYWKNLSMLLLIQHCPVTQDDSEPTLARDASRWKMIQGTNDTNFLTKTYPALGPNG